MKKLRAIAAAAVLWAVFLCPSANAQGLACAEKNPRSDLLEQHGEELTAQGITATGFLLQIFANEETGTFTVVLVPPDAPLWCEGGQGKNFMIVKKKIRD